MISGFARGIRNGINVVSLVCWLRLRPLLAPAKHPAAQNTHMMAWKIVYACLFHYLSANDADVNSPASSCVWQPSRPNNVLNAHHTVCAPQRLLELSVNFKLLSLSPAFCRMVFVMPFLLPSTLPNPT